MAMQTKEIFAKRVGVITVPAMELPTEDSEPLETSWHRSEINLLIESLKMHWRGRQDFYVGGNMFIYFTFKQAQKPFYRGPDFFVVLGVDGSYSREAWVVWEEDGRYPDLIIELLSRSTAEEDLTTKKDLYEKVFRTPEYFCYNPDTRVLRGWRLMNAEYEEIKASERGWLWSERLDLWLGLWKGKYLEESLVWLRFYNASGELAPTFGEAAQKQAEQERQRAEQERQQAEQERQRAERAEAQLSRLRERLRQQGVVLEENDIL
jgi:Uma2 family endonuclease